MATTGWQEKIIHAMIMLNFFMKSSLIGNHAR